MRSPITIDFFNAVDAVDAVDALNAVDAVDAVRALHAVDDIDASADVLPRITADFRIPGARPSRWARRPRHASLPMSSLQTSTAHVD